MCQGMLAETKVTESRHRVTTATSQPTPHFLQNSSIPTMGRTFFDDFVAACMAMATAVRAGVAKEQERAYNRWLSAQPLPIRLEAIRTRRAVGFEAWRTKYHQVGRAIEDARAKHPHNALFSWERIANYYQMASRHPSADDLAALKRKGTPMGVALVLQPHVYYCYQDPATASHKHFAKCLMASLVRKGLFEHFDDPEFDFGMLLTLLCAHQPELAARRRYMEVTALKAIRDFLTGNAPAAYYEVGIYERVLSNIKRLVQRPDAGFPRVVRLALAGVLAFRDNANRRHLVESEEQPRAELNYLAYHYETETVIGLIDGVPGIVGRVKVERPRSNGGIKRKTRIFVLKEDGFELMTVQRFRTACNVEFHSHGPAPASKIYYRNTTDRLDHSAIESALRAQFDAAFNPNTVRAETPEVTANRVRADRLGVCITALEHGPRGQERELAELVAEFSECQTLHNWREAVYATKVVGGPTLDWEASHYSPAEYIAKQLEAGAASLNN